jgi:hypothetical protein
LRRGKPEPVATAPSVASTQVSVAKKTAAVDVAKSDSKTATSASVQWIPAVSDATAVDPRPYILQMKPAEEQEFRQKMLALATEEVRSRAKQLSLATVGASAETTRGKFVAKAPVPVFDDVQLRVFDLSNSNEPVVVLTASAKLSSPPRGSAAKLSSLPVSTDDPQYFVLLVAKQDIYGDLHKAFSTVTDSRHLDSQARIELIDAVDADGDGRGELLFRRISDSGTAFDLYRVIGYQLWPLFQGTPTEQ